MGHFTGTYPCLSALYAAGRHEELLDLVEHCPYRQWGVKALVAMGRKEQALSYAEESPRGYEDPVLIAQVCEEILLSDGRADEAYQRYAMDANRRGTNLATFRAIAQKYPHLTAGQILNDLAAGTPGEEGKWFAAAKSAGLLGEALELARRSPCDPKTLTRAARDFAESNPLFAIEAGMTALLWLVRGYGYEITGLDVWAAHDAVMKAAESVGRKEETVERMRALVAQESGDRFVSNILGRTLGLR